MVQIRRARPLHPKRGGAARGVLASVALSALIPLLFALRLFSRDYLFRRRQQPPAEENPYVRYLQSLDLTKQHNNLPGNVVELHYCDTSGLDWSEFVQMVEQPILQPTLTALLREQDASRATITTINDQHNHNLNSNTTAVAASSLVVAHEWLLQLLEQYLQITGRCDYHRYRPTVPPHAATTVVNAPSRSCLAVVVISAFRDADQLEALLQALLVPSAFLLEGDGEAAPPQDDDDDGAATIPGSAW